MSRIRTDTRRTVLAVVSFACVVWLIVFASSAHAGVPPSSDSTTTTEESTTTTTEAVTTTTAATTTQPRPSSTSTTVPRSTSTASTAASTTTTAAPPSSVEEQAPEIISDDTLPRRTNGSDDGGLSTDTKLAFVVGGLAAVGVLIGLLTFLYWRHTRPQRYMDALDALADVEQKVPRSADDVPTAEHAAIPAGVAAGAAGATTAVRILEPDKPASTNATATNDDTSDASPKPDGQPASDASSNEPVSLDEPTTITTIEDLKTKGAFEDD